MKLEILPIRERDGSKILPRRRGVLRVLWIVGDAPRSSLSGGYTLRASPI